MNKELKGQIGAYDYAEALTDEELDKRVKEYRVYEDEASKREFERMNEELSKADFSLPKMITVSEEEEVVLTKAIDEYMISCDDSREVSILFKIKQELL